MRSEASRRLEGRVAVVTGVTSGIGMACAELLAQHGATVHGLARRDLAAVPSTPGVAELLAEGRVVGHEIDVMDDAAVAGLAAELAGEAPVDIVVCAAGTNIADRDISNLSLSDWRLVIDTNLHGTFHVLHAFLPQLAAGPGDVVMVSSVAADWPDHSGPAYQASKAGMLGLSRGAAYTAHREGVRFTNVLPGLVNTPLLDRRPAPPPAEIRQFAVQPEDVAEACLLAITLPRRVTVSEITLVATYVQSHGKTQDAAPTLPSALIDAETTEGN